MNYLQLKYVLFYLFAILGVNSSAEEISDLEQSEEFENAALKDLRADYSRGFQDVVTFFDSINSTIAGLTAKILKLETSTSRNIKIVNEFFALKPKLSWAEFDKFIAISNAKVQKGKSFNGTSLSDIKSRVSSAGHRGEYTAVVFANYLDEAITDFAMYDRNKAKYDPAPSHIPPRTEEVFTFADPKQNQVDSEASFSYVIPSSDARIAVICRYGAWAVGLAFVPKTTDMKSYYDSTKGIDGSSAHEHGDHVNRQLSVGYQNFVARISADSEGQDKATLRIELIRLSLSE